MIVLLDSTKLVAQLLEPKLRTRLPTVGLEIFSSFDVLHQRLSGIHNDTVIAILAIQQPSQLSQLLRLRQLFVDVRMVLILPDRTIETIRLAHQLYPRFISFRDGNLDDLVAVVARMHKKLQSAASAPGLRH